MRHTVTILLTLLSYCIQAEDAVKSRNQVVAAVVDNLNRIATGEYEATGHFSRQPFGTPSLKDRPAQVFEENIECYFDRTLSRQSFRRQRHRISNEPSDLDNENIARFVSFPDRIIRVTGQSEGDAGWSVGIHPYRSPEMAGTSFFPVFDIRSLPFVQYRELASPFERVVSVLDHAIVEEPDSAGLVPMSRTVTENRKIHRWWTDPQQGHQVVRYTVTSIHDRLEKRYREVDELHPERPPLPRPPNPPTTETTTRWELKGDAWVPVAFHLESTEQTSKYLLDLKIQWKSVNQPIPDAKFDWKTWNLPKNTRVVDMRLGGGQGILLDTIGQSREIPVANDSATLHSSSRVKFLYANLVLLGGLLGGWLFRIRSLWRRKSPATSVDPPPMG